jgi:hypothetical protein
MKTRIFALALTLIMTLTLAACGSDSNTPANDSTPTPSSSPTQGESEPTPDNTSDPSPTEADNDGDTTEPSPDSDPTPSTSGETLAELAAELGATFILWDDIKPRSPDDMAMDDYYNLKDSGIKDGTYFINGFHLPDDMKFGDGSAAAAVVQNAGFSQATGIDAMTSGTYYIRVDTVNIAGHSSAIHYIFVMP